MFKIFLNRIVKKMKKIYIKVLAKIQCISMEFCPQKLNNRQTLLPNVNECLKLT